MTESDDKAVWYRCVLYSRSGTWCRGSQQSDKHYPCEKAGPIPDSSSLDDEEQKT